MRVLLLAFLYIGPACAAAPADEAAARLEGAVAALAQGRYEQAAAEADAGLAAEPRASGLLAVRAAARLELGRAGEALDDAERAAALAPEDHFARAQLARARAALGPPWWARPGVLAAGLGALLAALGFAAALLRQPRPRAGARGLVGGSFRLGRKIGEGGMGAVYEAWDENLERPVAVKRIAAALREEPDEARRFVQEAKTVASLKHPGIVSIYDAFEDAGELYLVFELVRGETLADHVERRGGRLPAAQALRLLEPLCAAVDYAHARGVIHRDLKPANIMLEDGAVKVMDFGIARRTRSLELHTRTSVVAGTPAYMAPEQELGEVSKEADVYALAVCAYWMLAGRLPFAELSAQAKREGRLVPLGGALDAVFARALHPERAKRHRSAGELLEALRSAAA